MREYQQMYMGIALGIYMLVQFILKYQILFVFVWRTTVVWTTRQLTTLSGTIVPFHKDFSPSGKQLEHRKLAHE